TLYRKTARIFPDDIRKNVLKPKTGMVCTITGIGYGAGSIWVEQARQGSAERYGIASVNLPESTYNDPVRGPRQSESLQFIWRADRHRVVIDTENGKPRYRSWSRPKFATEHPDLELRAGSMMVEGTAPCTHAVWSFKNGSMTYSVSELGCTQATPPSG